MLGMLKINYFTFQEVLNLYPARAPRYPHDKTLASDWFTKMLEDAGLEFDVYTLNSTISDDLINSIVNALMTVVYNRHDEDIFYQVTTSCDVTHTLAQADFIKAINSLLNVLDLTLTRYIPLLQQNEIYSDDPVGRIGSSTSNVNRFNDTPQNDGEFEDNSHNTNVSKSMSETSMDSGSIMARLDEMFKNFKSIILEWSNEFNQLFLKEEQL